MLILDTLRSSSYKHYEQAEGSLINMLPEVPLLNSWPDELRTRKRRHSAQNFDPDAMDHLCVFSWNPSASPHRFHNILLRTCSRFGAAGAWERHCVDREVMGHGSQTISEVGRKLSGSDAEPDFGLTSNGHQ